MGRKESDATGHFHLKTRPASFPQDESVLHFVRNAYLQFCSKGPLEDKSMNNHLLLGCVVYFFMLEN